MSSIVVPTHRETEVKPDTKKNLKNGFYASLAIHGVFLLMLLVVASLPHRFHFNQTALIELQGISGGVKGSPSASPKTASVKQTSVQPKAPNTASLKPKAQSVQASTKTDFDFESSLNTKTKQKMISVKQAKKPAVAQPNLKERILQRLQKASHVSAPGEGPAMGSAEAIPAGDTIGTNVPFPFASYLAEVQNRITDLWEQPSWLSVQNSEVKAVVVFRINRDGSLAQVMLAVPSGVTAFDKSAVQAVEAVNPLPPLPAEFKNPFLDVHLLFDLRP